MNLFNILQAALSLVASILFGFQAIQGLMAQPLNSARIFWNVYILAISIGLLVVTYGHLRNQDWIPQWLENVLAVFFLFVCASVFYPPVYSVIDNSIEIMVLIMSATLIGYGLLKTN